MSVSVSHSALRIRSRRSASHPNSTTEIRQQMTASEIRSPRRLSGDNGREGAIGFGTVKVAKGVDCYGGVTALTPGVVISQPSDITIPRHAPSPPP